MRKLNYAKDRQIDAEALDVEWLEQPDLEAMYIEQVSELRREKNYLHEELKTVRSELVRDAFADPEGCCGRTDGKAATQPQVEAYYRTHERYKEVKEQLIDAEDAFEVAKDMKDMIHFTRTKALENLVDLHGQGYFAGPNVPRNLSNEAEKKQERRENRNKKTSKKMRRSKK